jgi:hypothetical protein
MTTATMTCQRSGGGAGRLLFVVLAAALLGAVLLGAHATERHGPEAEMIRRQCHQSGPDEVWRSLKVPDVIIWLIQLTDGRWGCWFQQNWPSQGAELRECTAFVPCDGGYNRVTRYLSRFAERIR